MCAHACVTMRNSAVERTRGELCKYRKFTRKYELQGSRGVILLFLVSFPGILLGIFLDSLFISDEAAIFYLFVSVFNVFAGSHLLLGQIV